MKPLKANIIVAEKLVEKYESLTLKEITKAWISILDFSCGKSVANFLTGFGETTTCTLCQTVRVYTTYQTKGCRKCIYEGPLACSGGKAAGTYQRIENAETPKQLLNAFKARAKFIRSVLANIKRRK